MYIFPNRKYRVDLKESYSNSLAKLKQYTDQTHFLVSDWTKKEFRGQVNEKGFRIISSEIGRGAVCVFIGTFEGKKGLIEVKIHKAFKVMFSILLSYPFIGFGLTAYNEGFEHAVNFIPILLIGLIFIRFVFMELSFRLISKTGINKLNRILGINKIIKTRHNNGEHEEPL